MRGIKCYGMLQNAMILYMAYAHCIAPLPAEIEAPLPAEIEARSTITHRASGFQNSVQLNQQTNVLFNSGLYASVFA